MDATSSSRPDRAPDPADASLAEAADTPLGAARERTVPSADEPTGHHGPGYGDTTPVAGDAPDDHREAFRRWREQEIQSMEADYAAWCESGETRFPDDFHEWRRQRRVTLLKDHSPAGLPLGKATEDAPESEKASLLFERS